MRVTLKSIIVASVFSLFALVSYGQTATVIKGKVTDNNGESVIGANIYLKGTTIGTVADLEGSFALETNASGDFTLVVSFVGMLQYETEVSLSGSEIDLGEIVMESDAVGLAEVSVFANIAIDRKTPVPVSNIMPEMIETRLGTQEYPEILKSTPGVYATKQGGAFGDSRINIRGFNARNSAVMINGVPVNDMENGWVYWSNWAGLSEVTRTMQVQRGLGASKIAIPSVGGTINVLTKTTDAEPGGVLTYGVGADGYNKVGLTLSSGLTDNNWATTVSIAKSSGDGYVDGTAFESYSYYLNISKLLNTRNRFAFSVFGAPQWHGQRSTRLNIDVFKDPAINSIRYNYDWGYKDGQEYYVRKNFYHKPMGILNWFLDINDNFNISTAAYLSIGTGGGTGSYGNTSKFTDYRRNNLVDFDRIVDENIAAGALGSESILRASVNNHFWSGLISTATYNMQDWLTLTGGVDVRYYKGIHYREVTDLLGGDYFVEENVNVNNPVNVAYVGDRIDYNNDGIVGWYGAFGQGEAEFGDLTAFFSAAISNKSYKRVEYFLEEHDGNGSPSSSYNFLGYSAKAGANYNISSNHNVFVNAGYFENQPDFRTVFYNYTNDANADAPNEKVMSFEVGYGFRSGMLAANVNAYYTTWKDKARVFGYTDPATLEDRFANLEGINARHMGVELDFTVKPISKLSIRGMASVGDWIWMDNLEGIQFYDDNQNPILSTPASVYIKDVHVGDAAQITAAASVSYELLAGLKFGVDFNHYDKLFAYFGPENRTSEPDGDSSPDAWKMPSYQLMDMFMSYKFDLGQYRATLIGNVNNLFDTEYISDATDGTSHGWDDAQVYYGWGRSWSVTLKVRF